MFYVYIIYTFLKGGMILERTMEEEIFINNLLEASRKKDKEFTLFIDENLNIRSSKDNIIAIQNRIDQMKKMTESEQTVIKARAKELEDGSDVSKYLPALLTIFALIISAYTILSEFKAEDGFIKALQVFVTIGLAALAFKIYTSLVKVRSTAVYFNGLLSSTAFENETISKKSLSTYSSNKNDKKGDELLVLINLILTFEKTIAFENDERVMIYKSRENGVAPRVHDYIKDIAFEEELLVKKVIWNFEANQCDVEVGLVGSTQSIEEIKEQALLAGWRLFKK